MHRIFGAAKNEYVYCPLVLGKYTLVRNTMEDINTKLLESNALNKGRVEERVNSGDTYKGTIIFFLERVLKAADDGMAERIIVEELKKNSIQY